MQEHRTPDRDGEQAGPILAAALEYHRRGWSIIPIAAGTKKPPKGFRWKRFQKRRPTEQELHDWFEGRDDLGLAVIFGEVSGGLVCRDFDTMASYHRWSREHPDLADTLPTVATARGRHVYFRSNHRGIVHQDDGELRGAGYCLLPPSVHPDGPTYKWLVPLPDGDLPLIDDIRAAGFLTYPPCNREQQRQQRTTEAMKGGGCLAALQNHQNTIDRIVAETLPATIGQRHRQVFDLARALKAVPHYADAAAGDLQTIVRRWHQEGVRRGVIGTEPFEETWIDFLRAWPRVKFPKGQEPVTAIFEKAKGRPLPQAARQYESPGVRLLVALCQELQRAAGDEPFFLGCRTAGRLLKVDHTTAWR